MPNIDDTEARIREAFAATGRSITPDRLRTAAAWLADAKSLDGAIAAAAHDNVFAVQDDLIAYRRARDEQRDPAQLALRLAKEAQALERQAAREDSEAAEFFGKAAWRRLMNDPALGQSFQARAEAIERCAARRRDEAQDKRLWIARLDVRRRFAVCLAGFARASA